MAGDNIADKFLSVLIKAQKKAYPNIDHIYSEAQLQFNKLADSLLIVINSIDVSDTTLLSDKSNIIDRVVKDCSDVIKKHFDLIISNTQEDVVYLCARYNSLLYNGFNRVLIDEDVVPSRSRFFYTEVPTSHVKFLLSSGHFMGYSVETFWDVLISSAVKMIPQNLVLGIMANENTSALLKRMSGSGGVYVRLMRSLRAVVVTLCNFALVQNTFELFRLNGDVVKGFRILNILDTRTTGDCSALHKSEWLLDGRSFKGGKVLPGLPPWHYYCRTIIEPIFYTKQDIISGADMPLNKKHLRTRLHNILSDNYGLIDNLGGRSSL